MHRTYATCVVQLATLISVKDGRDFLIEHWRKYFESDDQFWIEIQAKVEPPIENLTYLLYISYMYISCLSWVVVAWRDHELIWTTCLRCLQYVIMMGTF